MSVTKETITVTYVGKFGPRVGETWYLLSSKSGLKPDNFEKGKTYNVLIHTSQTGKKYIDQIVGEQTVTTHVPEPIKEEIKAGDDKLLEVLKKEDKKEFKSRDFDAEARGKVACAAWCAAVSSQLAAQLLPANKIEDAKKIVRELAEDGINFTWEHQKEQ